MRLKLDENLPATAAPRLAALGFDVDTVVEEGLGGRCDADVWAAAQREGQPDPRRRFRGRDGRGAGE
ncbi:MAG: DUF5615 family PIN-like protein [Polyangiaceae bacterium]|nr:DUF5615 family PIN-like protein [Polyangiaceae bacterium]